MTHQTTQPQSATSCRTSLHSSALSTNKPASCRRHGWLKCPTARSTRRNPRALRISKPRAALKALTECREIHETAFCPVTVLLVSSVYGSRLRSTLIHLCIHSTHCVLKALYDACSKSEYSANVYCLPPEVVSFVSLMYSLWLLLPPRS